MHKRLQVLKEEKKRSGNFNRIGAAAARLLFLLRRMAERGASRGLAKIEKRQAQKKAKQK
jgi:hypothetical protein